MNFRLSEPKARHFGALPEKSRKPLRAKISRIATTAFRVSAIALLLFVLGCSRVPQDTKSKDFFVNWLQSHGEARVVTDKDGVGIAGNATRLRSSPYDSKTFEKGKFTAETEFRVRLPGGREIVEYVAGVGDSREAAENDCKANFIITTFHVVYRGFMNPADPHQSEERVTINGKPRVLVMGETMGRGTTTQNAPDVSELRPRFREVLSTLALSSEPHWVKIVYAQHNAKVMSCSVTLDNQENAALTEAVGKLPWPVQTEFYMVKQFIVIK